MKNKFSGTVAWFLEEKNYGFILADNGGEYFFHISEILMGGHKFIADGQRVEFEISKDKKGKDKAIRIKKVKR
jgi:CspA family cold shock protein